MTGERQAILLLTHSRDHYCVDRVGEALSARGADWMRVDIDHFPAQVQLHVDPLGTAPEAYLQHGQTRLALHRAPAIWLRRIYPALIAPSALDAQQAGHAAHDAALLFRDMLACLQGPRMLSPFDRILAAESKLRQLTLAHAVGLPVPPVMLGNGIDMASRLQQRSGQLVHKALSARNNGYAIANDFVFTRLLPRQSKDPTLLQELQFHPQIYQRAVPKRKELRIILVGHQTFVGSISLPDPDSADIDWRRAEAEQAIAWQADSLPDALSDKLHALRRRLGLEYGAVDMLQDDEGQYWFLEINPSGEYGWLERELGLPISRAIADWLIGDTAACST